MRLSKDSGLLLRKKVFAEQMWAVFNCPEVQRAKLRALGLCAMVDEIIVTDELDGVTFRKPNEAAFRLM